MESDVPIASFYFTLNGFDNILSANSLSPNCAAYQDLESLSFVENYFFGGDTDNNPIPNGTGIFLGINASYNSSYLNGQYLTIEDLSPGHENQETHFYTYDEDGSIIEMSYDWVPMVWELGTNNVSPWVGQDCVGDVWGLAFEDDCGVCSEGLSGHIANSDIDCDGVCFGISMLDDCGVCEGDNSTCINEGCTNPDASNYDENADVDDGSCCVELWGECYNIEETTSINFSNGELAGFSIPSEIGMLNNLETLSICYSGISGNVPSELWSLTNLKGLCLQGSQITGQISSEIENQVNLEYITIFETNMYGEIPFEIGNLPNLFSSLTLRDNQFSGEIPSSICNIINTSTYMVFSHNEFCPPYPECLSEEDIGYQDTSGCEEYLLGDVNFDGSVNVLDVITGANMILGNIESNSLELYVLDYNQDGIANILDMVEIVDYIVETWSQE